MLACLRWLVEERYPDAEVIRLVQDNLNTHEAALSTSVSHLSGHGLSPRVWTSIRRPSMAVGESIAELEISVFERGCLSRPVGDRATLEHRVATLEAERNAARATIHWQFTSREARVKLVDLYPVKQTERD